MFASINKKMILEKDDEESEPNIAENSRYTDKVTYSTFAKYVFNDKTTDYATLVSF